MPEARVNISSKHLGMEAEETMARSKACSPTSKMREASNKQVALEAPQNGYSHAQEMRHHKNSKQMGLGAVKRAS